MDVENFDIASWVKNERLKRGVTTRELSSKINRTPSYISQFERNVINKPKKEVIYRIVKVLKIRYEQLPIELQNFLHTFFVEEVNYENQDSFISINELICFLKKLPIKQKIQIQKELLDSIQDEL
jgi:transcriptional regulator with XRE-family HTH domain